jgi:hypothetical protein
VAQLARDVPADVVDDFRLRGSVRFELGDHLPHVIHGPHVLLQLLDTADLIRRLLLHHG